MIKHHGHKPAEHGADQRHHRVIPVGSPLAADGQNGMGQAGPPVACGIDGIAGKTAEAHAYGNDDAEHQKVIDPARHVGNLCQAENGEHQHEGAYDFTEEVAETVGHGRRGAEHAALDVRDGGEHPLFGVDFHRLYEVGEDVSRHRMHSEEYFLTEETAALVNGAHAAGRRVLAVGTTTVRVLESCAQEDGTVSPGHGHTELFLYPPYRPRAVDRLLTNFHLPKSTLLMLVSTFADREKVLAAYERAIRERMRFYSYGDCMLLK